MPFDWEYDLFKDSPVFIKGKLEGKLEVKLEAEKTAEKFVTYLLKEGNHSVAKIASLAGVPVSFVHRIQKKLKPQSNGNQPV